MKYILVMFLCSQLQGNACKQFEPEFTEFKTYGECAKYAYEYSNTIMSNFSMEFVEDYKAYLVFDCKARAAV